MSDQELFGVEFGPFTARVHRREGEPCDRSVISNGSTLSASGVMDRITDIPPSKPSLLQWG